MGRLIRDKNKRTLLREEFYEKVDQGNMTPQEAVKALRQITGLTQVQFAEKMSVSLVSLKSIEQGRGNPTLETLKKLLKIGGLRITVGRESK